MSIVTKRLIDARIRAGLSQGQAASLLQIERAALVHYEAGGEIRLGELVRLADLYQVSINWLMSSTSVDIGAINGLDRLSPSDRAKLVELLESLPEENKSDIKPDDERRVLKDVLTRAHQNCQTWPDWKRSDEARAQLATLPKSTDADEAKTRIELLIAAEGRTMTTESEETIMSEKNAAARDAVAPPTNSVGRATLVNTNCLEWLREREPNSIHAVVTDPPYGLREFNEVEKAKLRAGRGGVWRIPPEFDGCKRMPLPRFTTLTAKEQLAMKQFFAEWAKQVLRVLVPGGHVFVAGNPLVSHLVYMPMMEAGFEKRGEIIRLVQTLRGGDRPKNAHEEFHDVTVMPRSAWEPWGLFRKSCEGSVQENLRTWKTGGLRRESKERPFTDVIQCSPTRSAEREIANHPSLKPQNYMRQIVRAALPLGEGIVLDPFMGGGSTLAAAEFNGYQSIGIELDPIYFDLATKAIPRLAKYAPGR